RVRLDWNGIKNSRDRFWILGKGAGYFSHEAVCSLDGRAYGLRYDRSYGMDTRKRIRVKIDHAAHLGCGDIDEKRIVRKFCSAGPVNGTATTSRDVVVDLILC